LLRLCRIPELVFWHIPSTPYAKVAPKARSEIRKPCVGSINKEEVAPQEAEWGMMNALVKRPSVKVPEIEFQTSTNNFILPSVLLRCMSWHLAGSLCWAQPRAGLVLSIRETMAVLCTAHGARRLRQLGQGSEDHSGNRGPVLDWFLDTDGERDQAQRCHTHDFLIEAAQRKQQCFVLQRDEISPADALHWTLCYQKSKRKGSSQKSKRKALDGFNYNVNCV
jgi:hypothetical protein